MVAKGLRNVFRRGWLPLLIVGAAMFVVSLIVTRELPVPQAYEVRYEVYVVGANRPDTKYKDLSLCSPDKLCRYVKSCTSSFSSEVFVWSDKTGKLTLRLRNSDASQLLSEGNEVFSYLKHCAKRKADVTALPQCSQAESEIVLLNESATYQAHLTPNRWLVVIVSVLAAMLLSGVFLVFRFYASNAGDDDALKC